MTDSQQEKVQKLYDNRLKAQTELNTLQQKLLDSITNGDRRVRVERLVKETEDAMTKAFTRNEQLITLASKTSDSETVQADLEKWLREVTEQNDEILRKAREYIDSCTGSDVKSRSSVGTVNKSASKRSSTSGKTKTSSQRQKDLLLATQRREELERQNANAIRLAKQKQEVARKQLERERERLEEEQALQLQELEEENRRKLAEVKLTELELTDDFSQASDELHDTLSQISNHSKQTTSLRVSNWVNEVNEPDNVSNQLQTNTVDLNNVAGSSTPTVITDSTNVVQTKQAMLPMRSSANFNIGLGENQGQNQSPSFGISSVPTNPRLTSTLPANTTTNTVSSATVPVTMYPPVQLSVTPTTTMTQVNIPTSHVIPNLSAWTFPAPSNLPTVHATVPQPVRGPVTLTSTTTTPIVTTTGIFTPVVPIQSGGTTFYCNPLATTFPTTTLPIRQTTAAAANFPVSTFPTTVQSTVPPSTLTPVAVQDLAQLLTAAKKDHLPEWKLEQYSGDPLQWHEWIGQFRSAIDSAPLSNDVKLTYLKTLVTGKAKAAIVEFAYCGTMYQDALKTLERKFGQPQAVVSAHLDKLNSFPPLKMHNSENVIAFSATISAMVGVFRSLKYEHDLSSAALLGQAVQKLPPNMREAWSMHTVKKDWSRPTLLEFNEWLKDKAEAHERMKISTTKPKSDESTQSVTRTKTGTKVFAATSSSASSKESRTKPNQMQLNCNVCKDNHPLWRCRVFLDKTPTDRAKIVAENKLCFSCLKGNHSFRQCPQPRKCNKDGCNSSHNTLLHGAERVFQPKTTPKSSSNQATGSRNLKTTVNKAGESSGVCSVTDVKGLLQITEVEVHTSTTSAKVLALCDSACSHSWISEDLATKLNVKGLPTKLTVHGINSQQVVDTQIVELKLTPVHSGGSCSTFDVKPYVRKNLHVGNDVIDVDQLKQQYPHLEPVALSKYTYGDVEMILGQDVFHSIRPLEYFESDRKNTPIAVRLPLGWVLSGPLPSTTGLVSTCFKAVTQSEADSKLADQLRSWYEMESFAAMKQIHPRSADDARASKILQETTYHDGCRYQVGMLWADDESSLPNNYFSALVQLKSLERRLEKTPELKASYAQTIKDDFDKGYIVQVDKSDCFRIDNPREWYLPHHPVFHSHKPGKVRRVLNGAAKFHGVSLNSKLLTGPDLLQTLIHVLMRFRQHPYAVSADIEGMFLQVGVIPEDRPSLRFLWREDPATDVAVYQYVRHIFGSKDSPTCANYALQQTARDNRIQFLEAANSVENNFYMDDYLESSPTINEATKKAQDLVEMLAKGGFNLTKFVSNVPGLVKIVDPKYQLPAESNEKVLVTDEDTSHVLGLKWNHSRDTLVVSRGTTPDLNRPVTQRVVLSLVSAVYDPIGLAAPYTVTARLLLKDIWRLSGQQWDNNLPNNVSKKFLEWAAELPNLSEITIPRCYFRGTMRSVELHVFGDSSQDVFAAVAFLRARVSCNERTETQLAFVFGKARVAPMKALTIPKLELQAALLAARLKDEVQQALTVPVERTFMWTDSTTVLQWLHSIDKKPVFVANRVAEVLELTTVDEWNHVPTADNPADAGTRGLPAKSLFDSPWLKGPKFLMTPDWPFQPSEEILKNKLKNYDSNEINADSVYQETTANTASVTPNVLTLEWQRYSSYEKLLRIVAFILRILPRFSGNRTKTGAITDPVELESAEQKLFFLVHSETFPNEIKNLLKTCSLSKPSVIKDFSPFIGPNGLLRAQGRTKHLEIANFDVKHPILLDSRHPAVRLFLEHLHEKHCHQGVEYLRALIQQKFAIVKLRTTLRTIQTRCVTCRKRKAETLTPIMADLPKERLAFSSRPFTNTGLDYFGPFYVSVKRSTEKRWGFLFTCLTTRAVHFEVVPSMDTSSCVMGIERFVSRRGIPSVILSDNGTNFVASEKELLQNVLKWNQQSIAESMVKKGVSWKFNPPSAPHHSGVWERLVRSFKHTFYAILGNRRLTDEILTTVFCLVEQSLNARPLIPASADATDLDALTPNHFLLGTAGSSLPSHANCDFDHRKRYARAQAYSDAIWNRWLKEYVPTLNRRSKWSTQSNRQLKTGDLVWIVEPTNPRGYYPLARVIKLHFGSDAVARSAEVKTTSGNLVRPVVKLAPVLPSPDLIDLS